MSNEIIEIITTILKYTNQDNQLTDSLQPGLTLAEIDNQLKHFPFKLPDEAKQLYQWHNGTNPTVEEPLFYYHYFLSIEESLKVYHQWQNFNQQDFYIYPENIFPLFTFEGEYYAIECSLEQQKTGKIWHIYHDNICVYNSLYFMLKSFLECYEKEAYNMVLVDDYWETEVNEKQVAEIKLKYNPIRQNMVTELAKTGQYFEYP